MAWAAIYREPAMSVKPPVAFYRLFGKTVSNLAVQVTVMPAPDAAPWWVTASRRPRAAMSLASVGRTIEPVPRRTSDARVTQSMGVSPDGYVVGPDRGFDWTAPDEE